MYAKIKEFVGLQNINFSNIFTSIKNIFIGKEVDKGLIFKFFIFLILITTAYVYLNPVIYMISTMLKSPKDILDPTVMLVPTSLYFGHLQNALQILKYPSTLPLSLFIAIFAALMHAVSCAVAGYAFARLQFPLKKLWMGCLLVTLIMPAQVYIIPSILFFRSIKTASFFTELGFNIDYLMLLLPSVFGHGISGALFVIIFRQFFLTQPKELEEAAKIDGANVFRIFTRVVYPVAKPAILVVVLFSFVWTWNDFYYPSMYLSGTSIKPLATQMATLSNAIDSMIAAGEMDAVEGEQVGMATSFLVIFPPLVVFLFAQRWFIESVERTGIVE